MTLIDEVERASALRKGYEMTRHVAARTALASAQGGAK